jgi:hypothetical protein
VGVTGGWRHVGRRVRGCAVAPQQVRWRPQARRNIQAGVSAAPDHLPPPEPLVHAPSCFVCRHRLWVRASVVQVADAPVALRVNQQLPSEIEEMWRQLYLDVTCLSREHLEGQEGIEQVASWLNIHQPISLSVNGSLELGRKIWERSGVVVFTSGSLQNPALSCQARPQDGECFGELPPRSRECAHSDGLVVACN